MSKVCREIYTHVLCFDEDQGTRRSRITAKWAEGHLWVLLYAEWNYCDVWLSESKPKVFKMTAKRGEKRVFGLSEWNRLKEDTDATKEKEKDESNPKRC